MPRGCPRTVVGATGLPIPPSERKRPLRGSQGVRPRLLARQGVGINLAFYGPAKVVSLYYRRAVICSEIISTSSLDRSSWVQPLPGRSQ